MINSCSILNICNNYRIRNKYTLLNMMVAYNKFNFVILNLLFFNAQKLIIMTIFGAFSQRIKCSIISIFLVSACLSVTAQIRDVKIDIIETSDVHGNLFPFDFINQKPNSGSMARVSSFVKEKRAEYGKNCIVVDNGDILQGQPTVYYYNFIDTTSTHIVSDVLNYIGYDLGNMGNHDIEAGPSVYNRWVKECNYPVLGANIIKKSDGKTFLKPYEVIERDGVKIAFLGMITPAIPSWLPENLWKGLYFEDIKQSASKWIKIIKEEVNPEIIVGVFHAGKEGEPLNNVQENPSLDVAKNVPGFDIVMFGHDHKLECSKIMNVAGDSVLLIDPANKANYVANIVVTVKLDGKTMVGKSIDGGLVDMKKYPVDKEYMNKFKKQYETVSSFVNEKIGTISSTVSAQDSFFGSSAFIDLIHELQLKLTGADISLTAPLASDAKIEKGDINVSDMFNLYRFENMLYVMNMSGKEIKDYLEYSYNKWINQMKSPDDTLMMIKKRDDGRYAFKNMSFNFDSAAGIDYVVDVTKPFGKRIIIKSMSNGKRFDINRTYKVALNSYRGNGGGDLLTAGAGISKEELKNRMVSSTDKDLRFYLMEYIKKVKTLNAKPLNQWRFVPEKWVDPAIKRDSILLFGK